MSQLFLRDTWVEIDLDAISTNVVNIKKHIANNKQIMAVVKADGYGHGAKEVAETALTSGASWLGVALLDEGISLRLAGVEAPILVLGYVRPKDVALAVKYQISLTLFQAQWLKDVQANYQGNQPVFLHLKLDTGMGRIGIRNYDELVKIAGVLNEDSRFKIEGAFTHFATADEDDDTYYQVQYKRFKEMLIWLRNERIHPNIIHCGNSAASLKFPNDMFNLIRFGIAMYGLAPSPSMKEKLPFPLKEAFSLHSRLTHVKKVNKGDSISYGATYTASNQEWIGTIPIGYADGWIRALASNSEVLINGRRHPIVGRICMDQCMCRLNSGAEVEDKVTLIGQQGDERISIDDIAFRLGTINYEVPCLINNRIPRIYFKEGQQIKVINPLLGNFDGK